MGLDEVPIGKRGRCFIYRMVALTRNPNLIMTANTTGGFPRQSQELAMLWIQNDTDEGKFMLSQAWASCQQQESACMQYLSTCLHVVLGSRLRRSKFAISAAQQAYANLVYIYICYYYMPLVSCTFPIFLS